MTDAWSPIPSHEKRFEKFDFSQFHALDHWPWSERCREQIYGGGWHHVKIAWTLRRRDQWFWWWFRATGCWWGRHTESLWRTARIAGVSCLYCGWTRSPSEKELEDLP